MFSLFLSFPDPEFERKYQKDCETVKFLNFYKFILCEMILVFVIEIFQVIYAGFTITRLAVLLVVSLLSLIIYVLDRTFRKWKYINSVFILIHISFLLVIIELISENRYDDPKDYILKALIYVSPLQVLFCSILIAPLKLSVSIIFCIIFQIFFMMRIYTFDDFKESPVIILDHLVCVLVFSLMGYYQEISNRSFYKMINESNKRLGNFEILLKNIIPSPIFILDTNNRTSEFINVSAMNFLKNQDISNEELVFKAVEELLTKFQNKEIPKLQKLYETPLTEFEKKMEFSTYEVSLIKEPGVLAYYHLKFLKLKWNSKCCILMILADITESHRIKELRNLDAYKDQLLATVSHDLRTPLNGMLGMMELVSLNLNEKKDKKNMNIAQASGHLLLNMINDILDFSQINNKKLRLSLKKLDLIELIKQTRKLIKFQAKSKGLDFILKLRDLSGVMINSDSNRIRQILLNLLNNALKFTPSGFIQISLKKVFNFEYGGFVYKIKVKDSGIGIKDHDFPKLFKLFGKLELDDPEINQSGVGLGLTISQNLAKMLSPRLTNSGIHLKSVYGKGSQFWFFLEGERNDDDFPTISPALIYKNVPYLFLHSQDEDFFLEHNKALTLISKEKILIVDDDMVNLMVAKRYCEYFDVDYLTANDGAEAIQLLEDYLKEDEKKLMEIKGIFMDCNMPIMDGYKATKEILELINKKNIEEIPIIGMTANVLHEDLENCLKCGMKSFLCKPVSRTDFGKVLIEIFKIKLKKF